MTDAEKVENKKYLKELAISILQERIDHASAAMKDAQQSANEDDKSSVGDKHHTGRAMAQNDRDIYARQMENAQKDLSFILHIDVTLFHKKIEAGVFMETETEKYFFLTGLGQMETKLGKVFFLSVSSPLGQALHDKKTGDELEFNKKPVVIKNLY
jgi:transcription elongation GreA/GreB family factor